MSEKQLLVDELTISYEGLFKFKELLDLINEFTSNKGYGRDEHSNEQIITETGKHIEIELRPNKIINNYVRNIIQIKIISEDLKEVDIEKNNLKVHMNQGKVKLIINGWLETDTESKLEYRPLLIFIRTVVDKYIYKTYNEIYKSTIISDIELLSKEIKAYLNLNRF